MYKNKNNRDEYTTTPEGKETWITDANGNQRLTRKVLVLDSGRIAQGSSFSSGLHQCLEVLHNSEHNTEKATDESNQEAFVSLPENTTVRSAYTVNFLKQYHTVFGVTGTARHKLQRENNYKYLIVPPHRPSIRENKHALVANNQKEHFDLIKQLIQEKIKAKKPVLLICKNDQQSKALHEEIQQDNKIRALLTKTTDTQESTIVHVDSLTEKEFETQAIAKAGNQGQVTISTAGMFGRGVDINADNLCVLSAYIPALHDEKQIKGRNARYGKKGEFRMIINRDDENSQDFNQNTYYFKNEIRRIQRKMAFDAEQEKIIYNAYAEFSEQMHQLFLKQYNNSTSPVELIENWGTFSRSMQQDWGSLNKDLLTLLKKENYDRCNAKFQNFQKTYRDKFTKFMINTQVEDSENETELETTLPVNPITISSPPHPATKPRKQIHVQEKYDISDVGQARIYCTLFAETRATLSGKRKLFENTREYIKTGNKGTLFPNLQATIKGQRPLFSNTKASIGWLPSKKP